MNSHTTAYAKVVADFFKQTGDFPKEFRLDHESKEIIGNNADLKSQFQIELHQLNLDESRMMGLDYKGSQVSYSKEDISMIFRADHIFQKKNKDGDYFLPEEKKLILSFSNGRKLNLNRSEFEDEFLPEFFNIASQEFIASDLDEEVT